MPLPPGAEPPLPTNSSSLNGPDSLVLERMRIRELMEGFPAHRDACEWSKLRALFADDDAYVFTTWSSGVPIDEFLRLSEEGFARGVKIAVRPSLFADPHSLPSSHSLRNQHRVNGGTVDVATSGPAAGKRGLGKLKACAAPRSFSQGRPGAERYSTMRAGPSRSASRCRRRSRAKPARSTSMPTAGERALLRSWRAPASLH